jgi:recombination protein RecA
MAKEPKETSALDAVMAKINKTYGDGSIMYFGSGAIQEQPVISTGSLALDLATGIGGIPRGGITEIWGPESAGKSTLAMHMVAEAQKSGDGRRAAYMDVEQALDPGYAAQIGVNMERLVFSQPGSGEEALNNVVDLVNTGEVNIVIIDSVAALIPMAELEGDMGASHMGLQARLMSQAMRKLTPIASATNTAIVFINQIRHKIGVTWGSNETTTGGDALKYYAKLRMEIRRKEIFKNGDKGEPTGIKSRVVIKKNKCAPPFREAEIDIQFGTGIDAAADALDTGIFMGLITQKGANYTWGDTKLGYGRDATITALNEERKLAGGGLFTDLRDSVRGNMRQRRGLSAVPAEAADGS